MTSGHILMRWWPLGYAAGWATFAVLATNPRLLDSAWSTHVLAGTGAILLTVMAFRPAAQTLRMVAVLVAIAFPLYRFLSLAWEPTPGLPTTSRIVAMTAWALLAFSLVVLYPVAWFEGRRKVASDAGRE